MKIEKYRKGKVVCKQGDPGDCMYYIVWGEVGGYTDYGTPQEKQLATLRQGDYFGEMSLIDHAARSATIVSLDGETELRRIDEDEFEGFLATNPAKVHDILAQLCHKLRDTTRRYVELCASVHDAVGDAHEVDDARDYHFGDDARLVAAHDRVQQQMTRDA